MKLERCIKELERLYGIELGSNRYEKNSHLKTQEQLADMIGISVDTLNNYKKLTELVPELQDWVETGNVIVICVVYHIPIISCTCVYLACKGVYEYGCDLGRGDFGADLGEICTLRIE